MQLSATDGNKGSHTQVNAAYVGLCATVQLVKAKRQRGKGKRQEARGKRQRQNAKGKETNARYKCKRQEASSLEVRGVYCELLTVGGGKFDQN